MPRRTLLHTRSLVALATAMLATPAAAQHATSGLSAASFSWDDGRREHALGAVLQLAPAPWLVLGAVPTLLHVDAPGAPTRMGLADLPVLAGIAHTLDIPGRLSFGVGGSALLPTGSADEGLGRGRALVSGEGSVGITPLPGLTVRGGGARLLRDGGEVPRGVATTTLFADAVVGLGAHANVSIGVVREQRGEASAFHVPHRALNAAFVHTTPGGAAIMLGAARTMQGAGPRWSLAIGIGTAFAGLAPIGAGSVTDRGASAIRRPAGPVAALPLVSRSADCRLLGC